MRVTIFIAHGRRGVEVASSMFFGFLCVLPCLRRFSASQWFFLPFLVWRYLLCALQWFLCFAVRRHSSQQYAWPLKQLLQIQKWKSHHRHWMRISNTLACLRPCKQPEGAIKGNYGVELPDACGSSCIKPEVAASGFSSFYAFNRCRSPAETQATPPIRAGFGYLPFGSKRQADRIRGMIWILELSWN